MHENAYFGSATSAFSYKHSLRRFDHAVAGESTTCATVLQPEQFQQAAESNELVKKKHRWL